MKTLYLECNMGAAGDMLMAALLELHPDREEFLERINGIGLREVSVMAQRVQKCGITGTHMTVTVSGREEESCDHVHEEAHVHSHDHTHDGHAHSHGHDIDHHSHDHTEAHTHGHVHSHEHEHRGMEEISSIINGLAVSGEIRRDIRNIYQLIADAESRVHGKEVSEVHFHEVGMMDAIADITGCVMLFHELGAERIVTSPINVGFGQVRCAHGILPVPAPATARLLEGIPCYAGRIEGELCTPTGAAVLRYFTNEWGRMPQMTVQRTGYGMGRKDFEAANCIRAMLGETEGDRDQVAELSCNLDDMTPEEIGFAAELLMEEGALDVYTTAIGMKKGRPGILLSVICRPDDRERMAVLLFKHTTTIGIRETFHNRMVMERREYVCSGSYGEIRIKECTGYGVKKSKPEYEDLRAIAKRTGMPLGEIREKICRS